MKKTLLKINILVLMFGLTFQNTNAQTTNIEVSGGATWLGFMNVFNLNGGFEFASAWGLPDVKSVPNAEANTITLFPNYNTYNPTDSFWANGVNGNKTMEANTFIETTPTSDQTIVTFSGFVQSYTLVDEFTTNAFIKVLDPNNNFNLILFETVDLVEGENFTVSVENVTAGLLVQTGFQVIGLNANPITEIPNGNIVVTAPNLSNQTFETTGIKMYPNPASSFVNFVAPAALETIEVYNTLGQQIANVTPQIANYSLNTSNLQNGIYIVKVQMNGLTSTSRLIIK